MTAHDDRARDEQDQALQDLVDQAQELGLYEQTAAPTARETTADELAEADEAEELEEELQGTSQLLVNMVARAEQAEQERDAARAEVDALSRLLRGMTRRLWKHRMAFRQLRQGGAAREHRLEQERDAARAEAAHLDAGYSRTLVSLDTARAELERLRTELERAQAEAIRLRPIKQRAREVFTEQTAEYRIAAHYILGEGGLVKNADPTGCPDTVLGECEAVCARCGRDMHPELERLRAQDTAAAALNAWSTMNEADRIFVRRYAPPLAAALDELVRVRREGER